MNSKRVWVAIAVLGCLLMITGCALAGFDFDALFADKPEYTIVRRAESLGAEDTVRINIATESIQIGLSDDDQAHVTYLDCEKEKHVYAYENGVLSLSVDHSNRKGTDGASSSLAMAERVVEVLLPAGFRGRLEASGATGTITADGLAGLARLALTVTTGDMNVSDCEAADASLVTTTGVVGLARLRGGAFYVGCTSGEVKIDGLSAEALTVRSVSGDVTLANATCDSIDASATSGDVRLEQIAAEDIAICVTTGDITGSIACAPTEFTIDSSTVTGENNLGAARFGGKRKLSVKTTTGDIQITFAE